MNTFFQISKNNGRCQPSNLVSETEFLQAAQKLADIPVVNNFKCLRQISKKNIYDFGLSMEFASIDDYQTYNDQPDHVQFVENRWIPEVTDTISMEFGKQETDVVISPAAWAPGLHGPNGE